MKRASSWPKQRSTSQRTSSADTAPGRAVLHAIRRVALEDALRDGLVSRILAKLVATPSVRRSEVVPLSRLPPRLTLAHTSKWTTGAARGLSPVCASLTS